MEIIQHRIHPCQILILRGFFFLLNQELNEQICLKCSIGPYRPISDSTAGCPDFQRKQPRISPEGRVHRKSHSIFCHWSSDLTPLIIKTI